MPALVAHRGYAEKFPENTFVAIEAAIEAGAKFLEFDVQLSKDLEPFLIHDDNLVRTADRDLSVFDLDIAQIEAIEVGEPARFASEFSGVRSLRLSSLCDKLNAWPDLHVFIEIKRQSVERFGLELVVDKVLEAIASLRLDHTVISFRADVVERIQEVSDVSHGWVIGTWDDESLRRLQELSPDFVFCNYRKIPPMPILPFPELNWVLYEVIDQATAWEWRSKGAAMIETMAVGSMLAAIEVEES